MEHPLQISQTIPQSWMVSTQIKNSDPMTRIEIGQASLVIDSDTFPSKFGTDESEPGVRENNLANFNLLSDLLQNGWEIEGGSIDVSCHFIIPEVIHSLVELKENPNLKKNEKKDRIVNPDSVILYKKYLYFKGIPIFRVTQIKKTPQKPEGKRNGKSVKNLEEEEEKEIGHKKDPQPSRGLSIEESDTLGSLLKNVKRKTPEEKVNSTTGQKKLKKAVQE
jgi:hypothetical protein